MSNAQTIDAHTGAPVVTAADLDGVRTSRVFAFIVDYLIVAFMCIPVALVIVILGIPTLGLAWGLLPFVIPAVAVLYVAVTMGGDRQATIGMRMNGIRVYKLEGGKVNVALAALHHILFLVIQGFAIFLPLLITFFSSKKRLLHDIALGTYVARDLG